jgi:hypothetical protein
LDSAWLLEKNVYDVKLVFNPIYSIQIINITMSNTIISPPASPQVVIYGGVHMVKERFTPHKMSFWTGKGFEASNLNKFTAHKMLLWTGKGFQESSLNLEISDTVTIRIQFQKFLISK